MSEAQCAAIRRFVERGGSLFATGETSLYDEWGDARPDFALADLFGATASAKRRGSQGERNGAATASEDLVQARRAHISAAHS